MKKKFHITISYGGKCLINCDSLCAAYIGEQGASTLCVTGDIAVRVMLAARVKVYLNSLINTIVSDAQGISKIETESIIEELANDISLEEQRIDPTQGKAKPLSEILDELKKAMREEGGGSG